MSDEVVMNDNDSIGDFDCAMIRDQVCKARYEKLKQLPPSGLLSQTLGELEAVYDDALAHGREWGYDEGHEAGYGKGADEGKEEGYENGYTDGFVRRPDKRINLGQNNGSSCSRCKRDRDFTSSRGRWYDFGYMVLCEHCYTVHLWEEEAGRELTQRVKELEERVATHDAELQYAYDCGHHAGYEDGELAGYWVGYTDGHNAKAHTGRQTGGR